MRPRQLVFAICVTATISCGSDITGLPGGATLRITPGSISIGQTESQLLDVVVIDADGAPISGVPVTFTSGDTTKVTVSAVGEVVSVGPAGSTTVEVKAERLVRNVPVTVVPVFSSIAVTPSPPVVLQKQTLQLHASVLDLTGDTVPGVSLAYSSLDPTIATVSPSGLVHSSGPADTAQIRISSGNLSQLVAIAVTQVPTSIVVTPDTLTLIPDATAPLSAEVLDAVGLPMTGVPLTYSSDNPSLVTVTSGGLVSSVGPLGNTGITVAGPTQTVKANVEIVNPGHIQGILDTLVWVGASAFSDAVSSGEEIWAGTSEGTVRKFGLSGQDTSVMVAQLGYPGIPIYAIDFNPQGTTAYIASFDEVTAIDVASGTEIGTLGFDDLPRDLQVSNDGTVVFVLVHDRVYVIDPTTLEIVDESAPILDSGDRFTLHPFLNRLYVSNVLVSEVVEIDATSLSVLRTFTGLGRPQDVRVSPDGTRLYAADEFGLLHVIDLSDGSDTPVSQQCGVLGLAVAPDGSEVYVSCSVGNEILIVDPTTLQVSSSINIGPRTPGRLAISLDGRVLIAGSSDAMVAVVK